MRSSPRMRHGLCVHELAHTCSTCSLGDSSDTYRAFAMMVVQKPNMDLADAWDECSVIRNRFRRQMSWLQWPISDVDTREEELCQEEVDARDKHPVCTRSLELNSEALLAMVTFFEGEFIDVHRLQSEAGRYVHITCRKKTWTGESAPQEVPHGHPHYGHIRGSVGLKAFVYLCLPASIRRQEEAADPEGPQGLQFLHACEFDCSPCSAPV